MVKKIWPAFLAVFLIACQKMEQPGPDGDSPGQTVIINDTLFCLDNIIVRDYFRYLEKHPYINGDYSYSVIDTYYDQESTYRKDHPAPAKIKWIRDNRAISQKVYVSSEPDFADANVYSVNTDQDFCEIYNTIPGRRYYWKAVAKIKGGDYITLGQQWFDTYGYRRFLRIDNVCNVRDLGGIETDDGKKRIRYGLLFRGGEMNGNHQDYGGSYCRIDDEGIAALRYSGVLADLDMRTDAESGDIEESPLGEDVDYKRYVTANQYYYDKFWNDDVYFSALKWIITELKAGKPVFFHCIYGADRTGTLAFIIEALLGVGENGLAIDYELTSFSYGLEAAPRRRGPKNELSVYRYRQMMESLLTSRIFTGSTLQEKIRNICIDGSHGSKYLSSDDIDWFQNFMLEPI